MPKPTVPKGLKKEFASKLVTYQKYYLNDNFVELSMYEDQLQQFGQHLEDHIQIGAFSGRELLEKMEIDYQKLDQKKKVACLAMLSDAFLEQGFEVNAYAPKMYTVKGDKGEGVHAHMEQKSLSYINNKQKLELNKWDKFWGFLGIQTEHAKEVKEYQEAQEAKKLEFQEKEAKLSSVIELLENNKERTQHNKKIVQAKEAESDRLFHLFVTEKTQKAVEKRTGKQAADITIQVGNGTLTPLAFCVGAAFIKFKIDLSNGYVNLSKDQKEILQQYGDKYYQIVLDTQKTEAEKQQELLDNLAPWAGEMWTGREFKPEGRLGKKSTEKEIGKTAVYMNIKGTLNEVYNGGNAYFSTNETYTTYNNMIRRAETEYKICDCLQNGEIKEAQQAEAELLKEVYTRRTLRSMKGFSSTEKSKAVERINRFVDKTLINSDLSWEHTLGLTNDILKEKEHRLVKKVNFYTPKKKALPTVKVIKEEPGMEEEVPDAVEKEETEIEVPELNNDDMEL